MVSDCSSSKGCRTNVGALKKAGSCSLSNGKNQANTSKKIHKAEREKLKRDHLNELFQELGRDLGQSNCKASILDDATRALRDLLAQLEKLREEHTALISESRYITLERDELKDDNLTLESDIGMLRNELNQRLQCTDHIWNNGSGSRDDTRLTLAQHASIPDSQQQHHPAFQTHGDTMPVPLVQRPQARYPSPSDSWPAQLLSSSGLPRASQQHEQEQLQDTQLSCTRSNTLTSCAAGAEPSTIIIQMDNKAKLAIKSTEGAALSAITALKKGSCLLKYGRRGKPKFCPFRLSADESMLIWFVGRQEKTLMLSIVSKIVPGQRTAIFQRYPQADKEYQSFSLIYKDRSLDLICKDRDEADVWFVGLKALISCRHHLKRLESKGDRLSDSSSSKSTCYKPSPLNLPFDPEDRQSVGLTSENPPASGFGRVFSDVILYTANKGSFHSDSVSNSLSSAASADNSNGRGSTSENFRVSLSSAVSSSSHGSGHGDFDALGYALIWGETIGDELLGGCRQKVGSLFGAKNDVSLPKGLESTVVLDVNNIACGSKHAALVTKQGEVFTWGEASGGRLGHAIHANVSQPKLVNALSGMNVEIVACGEYHTCAVTQSGDLYTWGDGVYNSGLLGHGSEASHWVPKLVTGQMGALHVSSVSCGPWHTAVVTSLGQLFTFGDGAFGALGHGDRTSINVPREVEALIGLRTISTACGVWHTAAVVEMESQSTNSDSSISRKLFTWGDGDQGRLGHEDKEHRLVPACVVSLTEPSICQVACGHDMTVALASSGRVYTMGSTIYRQLGNPEANGNIPTVVEGKLFDSFVEEISCGSHHVAVLTSKSEVYTWGKGSNGQLGHGDYDNRDIPTLVEALKDKKVKSVTCGLNFTAVICLHKRVSSTEQSVCSGCHLPFSFRRKRHNCYNCGQVFCKPCTSRKYFRAALAPNIHKPYRVCDDCYNKLKKSLESGIHSHVLKQQNASQAHVSTQLDEETFISRLSSVSSFKGGSRHSRQCEKSESNYNSMSLIPNEYFQRGNMQMPNSQNIMIKSSMKIYPASVPGSRLVCRSKFPLGGSLVSLLPGNISKSLVSAEVTIDELKKTNDRLRQEVANLKLQLEGLTQKSQNMESEFERKSVELKEAIAKVEEENARCKAAKEVIKSLTAHLKDTAERAPEVYMNNHSGFNVSHASNELKSCLSGTKFNRLLGMHVQDSNWHISDSLPSNASATSEGTEWVEQAEAGVYITVSSSPGGAKILKRIRFSRKRFSEEKAETWWAENRQKLEEKYIFPAGGRFDAAAGSPSMKKNNKNG